MPSSLWLRPAAGLCGAALAALVASAASAPPAAAAAPLVICPGLHCSASLIQDAIASALSGSTITVGAGVYRGDITIDKSVTLRALGPVTIDGGNSAGNPGAVVDISGSVAATIDGFTITGGYAPSSHWGGGIVNDAGTLTIWNSVIRGNNGGGTGEGGGIFNGGQLTVSETTITENTSGNGGGIANYGSLVLRGSRVTDNSAVGNGGGLDNAYGSGATISGTIFSGNSTADGYGGAIDNFESTLTLDGSVILDDSAGLTGGGIYSWPGTTPASTVSLGHDVFLLNAPNNCAGDVSC